MADEKMEYQNHPFHVPYEGIHRDAYMSLHTELNEPFRVKDNKLKQDFGVNQRFSFWTTPEVVLPRSLSPTTREFPKGGFEFCTKFTNPSVMLIGYFMLDGTLTARVKYDFAKRWTMKSTVQISHQILQGMFTADYERAGYTTQLNFGSQIPLIASCSKEVTPNLSVHGEVSCDVHLWNGNLRDFWRDLRNEDMRNVGVSARYHNPTMSIAGQVSTKKEAIVSWLCKISDKFSVVAEFMCKYYKSRYVVRPRIGCVRLVKRGRLFANINSDGIVAVHLEEQWTEGIHMILSSEVRSDYFDFMFLFCLRLGCS